jgi:hypothetical protein
LQLLDISRRLFEPDPEFQNLPMLYWPTYGNTVVNGLVEGPTWDAWWIQNSYGPTYCALPFLLEPYVTFLQNSQDQWFDQMGDGHRAGAAPPFNWVAPDGCLCDAARPGWIVYKQGDGRIDLHDWALEFTAAGIVLQSELLLISRDRAALAHYLPKLERAAAFIETRRDPTNNLFLAGPAGNLLAPSYAGWQKPDGTYGKAYLTGLSVNYIAALDRLLELEKLADRPEQAVLYSKLRASARAGLKLLTTEEGYLIRSLDPDGVKHGVFGAPMHGYFETSPNHDAICFRVVEAAQAEKIYAKLASIPQLRPHDVCIPNYPGYDDLYEKPEGLWKFGYWVNGGHWSTCEARLIMAYYQLHHFEDARRSLRHMLKFARAFRMDNDLTDFGAQVYQPAQPINLTYDIFGIPAAMVRGLFEYLYHADGLTIVPHIPPGITELQQQFPIRLGSKRVYLATYGQGPITQVLVNGRTWKTHDAISVSLPYDRTPDEAIIQIAFGKSAVQPFNPQKPDHALPPPPSSLVDLPPAANIAVNDLPLRIGSDSQGGNRFVGDIARVRILNRALSPEEQTAHEPEPLADLPRDSATVGDWRLDHLEAGAFTNLAAPEMPAKLVGQGDLVDAPAGKVLRLSGSGYLEIAHQQPLDLTSACTLEAWIRPQALPPGGARIVDKLHAGQEDGFLFDTFPGNSLRVIAQCGTLGHDAKLAPGQWAHVAATISPDGSQRLYLNGTLVAAATNQLAKVSLELLAARVAKLRRFHAALVKAGLADSYEAAHARLAVTCFSVAQTRFQRLSRGELPRLPERSQLAADQSYLETTAKLCDGLEKVLASYQNSSRPEKLRLHRLYLLSAPSAP